LNWLAILAITARAYNYWSLKQIKQLRPRHKRYSWSN